MKIINNILWGSLFLFLLTSCTTLLHVQMTPPLSAINSDGITKKDIIVGYIPPSKNKEVTLKKKRYIYYGLSSTLKLTPYQDSTPIFKKVLDTVYETVFLINDKATQFTSNPDIKYLLSITDIKTTTDDPTLEFGILGLGNDYSQNYAIAITCNIYDRTNEQVWKKEIVGKGHATEAEVSKMGDNLAPTRALLAVFQSLQKELITLEL